MNDDALKLVVAFDKLNSTPEKELIKSRYLSDKTSSFEFYSEVSRYMGALDKDKS